MNSRPSIETALASAPKAVQRRYQLWSEAVNALDAAPNGGKRRVARVYAGRLGIAVSTLRSRRAKFRSHGPIALLDKNWLPALWNGKRRACGIPPAAIAHLKKIADNNQLSALDAARHFHRQLRRWQGGDRSAAIPGWSKPPAGNPPLGLSARNLARHLVGRTRRPITWKITTVIRSDGVQLSQTVKRLKT
jgi:hypothetical protein